MPSPQESLENIATSAEELKGKIESLEVSLGKEPQPWNTTTSELQDSSTPDSLHPLSSKAKELTIMIEDIASKISLLPSKPDINGQEPSTVTPPSSNPNT